MSQHEPNRIKSMSESEPCDSPKMRGGITLKKTNWGLGGGIIGIASGDFDFDFRCICATSVVIPLPISFVKGAIGRFLKGQAPDWLRALINRFKGNVFTKLKSKAKETVARKLAEATKKADALLARLQQKAGAMGRIKEEWRRYEDLLAANGVRLQFLRQSIVGKAEQFAKNKCKHPIHGFGPWEELIKKPNPETWYPSGIGYRSRARFIQCWNIAVALLPAQNEIKQIVRDNVEMEELIKEFRKASKVYDDLTAQWQAARREADNLWSENGVWDAVSDQAENLDSVLDQAAPDVKALFWDSFLNSLIWLLEITSMVQEKNCTSNISGLPSSMKGASLDPQTCECSLCPSPYKLCDLSSWVEYVLPNTPGTRQSDELNVCIECCDDSHPKARFWSGGLIGNVVQEFNIPPCSCECPSEIEDATYEWVKCEAPNACERGTFSSDKRACRSLNPPDNLDGLAPSTSYRWDDQSCKWVCVIPCGGDCCSVGQCCNNGVCGECCSPGYRRKNIATNLFAQEVSTTTSMEQCVADCNYPGNSCYEQFGPGWCCVENVISPELQGTNACEPCATGSECCVYDAVYGQTCSPCPDKTHSLRFEDDLMVGSIFGRKE